MMGVTLYGAIAMDLQLTGVQLPNLEREDEAGLRDFIVTEVLPARSTARVEPRREWREILSSQGPAMCQTSFTPITSVKHLKTLQQLS